MDLQLSAAHLHFRNELCAWLAANLPRPWREEQHYGSTESQLERALLAAGY